ncbi:hypothetical protein [uncultured Campylobacter sp.]|uniref:hypothetical protein n=1 Tax=uncultured Campylobacter sp. TaxID=218934 RepID=UPI0026182747|nr:hypothetical protein [uncultured Campylobacter sp.]
MLGKRRRAAQVLGAKLSFRTLDRTRETRKTQILAIASNDAQTTSHEISSDDARWDARRLT